jgi:hypothetical protein
MPKNPSNLLIFRQTACMRKIFSSYLLAYLYLMKKFAKVLRNPYSVPVWETPNRPPDKKIVPAFLQTGLLIKMEVCAHTTRLPKK